MLQDHHSKLWHYTHFNRHGHETSMHIKTSHGNRDSGFTSTNNWLKRENSNCLSYLLLPYIVDVIILKTAWLGWLFCYCFNTIGWQTQKRYKSKIKILWNSRDTRKRRQWQKFLKEETMDLRKIEDVKSVV